MMTAPALVLGILISTLIGVFFHLILGGSFGRLILDIGLAWFGFWLGQFVANRIGWTFLSVGPLHLGMAVLFCLGTVFGGHWLSLLPRKTESAK